MLYDKNSTDALDILSAEIRKILCPDGRPLCLVDVPYNGYITES